MSWETRGGVAVVVALAVASTGVRLRSRGAASL